MAECSHDRWQATVDGMFAVVECRDCLRHYSGPMTPAWAMVILQKSGLATDEMGGATVRKTARPCGTTEDPQP